jgi:hypothetical protein
VAQLVDAIPSADVYEAAEPKIDVAVSVVVLATERPESLTDLYREYAEPLRELRKPFEFIFAAEPWAWEFITPLSAVAAAGEPIRILRVGQTMGEAALLRLAASYCHGSIIVTLPAYYRVKAAALVDLIERVEQGADLAVARRWPRRDSWINRVQNRGFHILLHRLVGGRIHDVACGVRAMRREVLEGVPLYGDFSRFFPLLALREGYGVEEVPAAQHERDRRTRVYGPGVYVRRVIDVLGLFFLLRFTEKPLRFFGLVGCALVLTGGAILGLLVVQRLGGQGIANRPLLLLGNLAVVLGVQAVALGLIGEIIVHLHAGTRRSYRLSKHRPTGESGPRLRT